MIQKAKRAFRTISEAADDLDVPQHVLRFWETKFSQVKPLKRGGNRRYYRPEDLNLLHAIKHQLYDEGHSIKGVQAMMREQGLKVFVEAWLDSITPEPAPEPAPEPEIEEVTPEPVAEEIVEEVTEVPLAQEVFEAPIEEVAVKAPEEAPEEIPELPLKEDDNTIRVGKDLVKALVNDLKALRQLIDRLPD